MHPCSTPPTFPFNAAPPMGSDERWVAGRAKDAQCLDIIERDYVFERTGAEEDATKFGGIGNYASVVLLMNRATKRHVAVKIFPFLLVRKDRDMQFQNAIITLATMEVQLSCLLNGLEARTSVFIKTLGWLICDKYPESWDLFHDTFKPGAKPLRPYGKSLILSHVFLFMDRAEYPLERGVRGGIAMNNEEARVFFFLLIHGLCVARAEYGFRHNDLHIGNIMVDQALPTDSGSYHQLVELAGQSFRINLPQGRYPKVIDFGKSTTDQYERVLIEPPNDMEKLIEIFGTFPNLFSSDDYRRWRINRKLVSRDNGDEMQRFLLEDVFFAKLRRDSQVQPVASSLLKCSFCGAPALARWNTIESLQFCNSYCADKVETFAKVGIKN